MGPGPRGKIKAAADYLEVAPTVVAVARDIDLGRSRHPAPPRSRGTRTGRRPGRAVGPRAVPAERLTAAPAYRGRMMRAAVVGGHGQVARHLLVDLRRSDVTRSRWSATRSTATTRAAGAPRCGCSTSSGRTPPPSPRRSTGCDAVVFAAGGGPDGNIERKRTVDLEGSLKSIEGAQLAGIRRFVQVSAINVDDPLPDDTGDVWRAYVEAKRDADAALRDERPGLDDHPARSAHRRARRPAWSRSAPEVARGEIPRADVAAVLAAVLDDPATAGKQWNVVSGDTPVADAVRALPD